MIKFNGTPEEARGILRKYWVPECSIIEDIMEQMDQGCACVTAGEPAAPFGAGHQAKWSMRLYDWAADQTSLLVLLDLLLAYGRGNYELGQGLLGTITLVLKGERK